MADKVKRKGFWDYLLYQSGEIVLMALVGFALPYFFNLSLLISALVLFLWIFKLVVFYPMFRDIAYRSPGIGLHRMIGLQGKVVQTLNPEGYVKVGGELWKARATKEDRIERDEVIKVVGVEGLKLRVKRGKTKAYAP